MSEMNDIDLSMIYRLQLQGLLNLGWIDSYSGGTKKTLANAGGKRFNSDINHWVTVDTTNYPYAIYDNGSLVDPSNYTLYPSGYDLEEDDWYGTVIFADSYTVNGTITAEFFAHRIHFIEGYPSFQDFEAAPIPMIAIDMDTRNDTPMSLGYTKFVKYPANVWIWGRNNTEVKALLDALGDIYRYPLPLWDFSTGFALNGDGSVNPSFDLDGQITSRRTLENINGQIVRVPTKVEKEFYRGRVSLTIVSDRGI